MGSGGGAPEGGGGGGGGRVAVGKRGGALHYKISTHARMHARTHLLLGEEAVVEEEDQKLVPP